jgi:hypothetical protein
LYSFAIRFKIVVLPQPLGPTSAITFPFGIINENLSNKFLSSPNSKYLKLIFSKEIYGAESI